MDPSINDKNDDPKLVRSAGQILNQGSGRRKPTILGPGGLSRIAGEWPKEPCSTVTSVREVALALEPQSADELGHLIRQLRELSEEYLMAIHGDPEATCRSLGVQTGMLNQKVVASLAKGQLEGRCRAAESGREIRNIVITAVLTLILS